MTDISEQTVLNDRYRLSKRLGSGGMGTVYRAHDSTLDRDVAVKVLSNAGLGTEGRDRLLNEAQAIARLSHPNIVSVFDAGEQDSTPYIVMEVIEGASLHDHPPQEMAEIARLAAQVCAALEHAHRHGVVHRDLKPENVLIAEDGTAKLMDFGIARSVASRMTTEGEIVGTVFYLAPEIALGQDFDGRADLYSLGVMLYELTTGELPFAQGDPLTIISQHIHATVVPPRAKRDSVPPRLDQLILQLMEKSPEDRPSSAAEAQKALERSDLLDPEAEGVKEVAVIRRMSRGKFVGREQELTDATNLWNRALAGEGQLLLVSGEPGIGKTRLIRELSTHVEITGGRSVIGECESEGGAPYAPFAQIVRKTLQQGSENGFNLPEFVLGDLLELAPELKPYYPDVPPNPKLEPEAEQQRLFENVVAFTKALSEYAPLMLVIDDAHWADSGSLSLLRYLASRTHGQRTLLAATYREVELDEAKPFHEALLELNRKRLGTRLKLKRFDEQQTRDLLAAVFEEEITGEFLEGIFGETEGNPFFIEEVCKALVESGQIYYTEDGWDRVSMDEIEIPQSVRVAIQSRVSKFPEEYQDTLNLAAVLGREFDFDTLAEASDLDEDTLIDALETAEDAQLIEEVSGEGGATFSFIHALIPTTLAEGVRTLRRRRLHKRVAAAIEITRPDDYEDLAHHYEEAGNEEKARNNYAKAGERAVEAYANQEAEDHLQAALDLEPDDLERADLLSLLADAVYRQGRSQQAIATRQEAADIYEKLGKLEKLAQSYTWMARDRWHAGSMEEALEICERGLKLTKGASTSGELAGLIHETARAHSFLGNSEKALELCNQALDMARRNSDRRVEADSLITVGINAKISTEDAVAAYEEAIEICQSESLLAEEARARNNLAVTLSFGFADLPAARSHYLKAAEIARKMGDLSGELFAYNNAISSTITQGELSEAEKMLAYGREIYDRLDDPGAAGENYLGVVSQFELEKGKLDQALAGRRKLLTRARETGSDYDLGGATFFTGIVLTEMEELNEAGDLFAESIAFTDKANWARTFPRAYLAMILARQQNPERAREVLEEAVAIHADRPQVWPETLISWANAVVLAAEKRWPESLQAFDDSVAAFDEKGMRTIQARAVRAWAEAHLARGESGDAERALELFNDAIAIYEDIGAAAYVERIRSRINEIEI